MQNPRPLAPDDGDGRGADVHDEIEPRPATRHRVDRALEPHQGARRHRRKRRRLRGEGQRRGPQQALLVVEPHADGLAGCIALDVEPGIHLRQQRRVDDRERRADWNRDERLLPHGLATRLGPALIVAFAGPTETGFK
jgi:hypothetical protein